MKISIAEALGYSVLGIVIVFFALTLLILVITLIGKSAGGKKAEEKAAPSVPAPAGPAPAAPAARGTYGDVALHGVPDRTAAMLMAIVAERTGLPLCELRFISIREVE